MATGAEKKLTLFEKLTDDTDPKTQQDIRSGKRIGLYRIKKQLGVGNFAKVKLGLHLLTNEHVAIKIIDKTKLDDESRKILSREVACMERLCHPSVIRLFEVIDTHQSLHLIMECASEGNVQDRVNEDGPLGEDFGRKIFVQVASAVNYMHGVGVVHRDLKAENVFFSTPTQIKLGDFGFSTLTTPTKHLETFCGSPPYAAPELFQSESYIGSCVDIWAMGVMLYFMMSGNMPFRGESVHEIKQKVVVGTYHMPGNISKPCQALIAGMLEYKAKNRYNMEQIANSEWVLADNGEYRIQSREGGGATVPASQSKVLQNMYQQNREDLDKTVLQAMKEFGVPSQDIGDQLTNEPRHPAAGIYRILLHRKLTNEKEGSDKGGTGDNGEGESGRQGSMKVTGWSFNKMLLWNTCPISQQKHKSKFCTIL